MPIGLFVAVAAAISFPDDEVQPGVRLDLVGAILVALTAGLLVFPLIHGRESGWPWWCFALLAGAVPAAWVLRKQILRSPAPILEASLLSKPPFVTGLALAPLAVGSLMTAALRARIGRRGLHLGLAVEILGLLLIALSALSGQNTAVFETGVIITGLGQGLLFGPVIQTIIGTADRHEIGSAAGAMTSLQQIATALGIAVLGTIFLESSDSQSLAIGVAVVIGLMFAVAGLVFRLPRTTHSS